MMEKYGIELASKSTEYEITLTFRSLKSVFGRRARIILGQPIFALLLIVCFELVNVEHFGKSDFSVVFDGPMPCISCSSMRGRNNKMAYALSLA
jgi:hypothetical protein